MTKGEGTCQWETEANPPLLFPQAEEEVEKHSKGRTTKQASESVASDLDPSLKKLIQMPVCSPAFAGLLDFLLQVLEQLQINGRSLLPINLACQQQQQQQQQVPQGGQGLLLKCANRNWKSIHRPTQLLHQTYLPVSHFV